MSSHHHLKHNGNNKQRGHRPDSNHAGPQVSSSTIDDTLHTIFDIIANFPDSIEPGAISVCASLTLGTAAVPAIIVFVTLFIRAAAALVATALLILGDAHPTTSLIVIGASKTVR